MDQFVLLFNERVTANYCMKMSPYGNNLGDNEHLFGTAARLRVKLGRFLAGLSQRTAEVQRICCTSLQAQVDAFRETVCRLFAHVNMQISH